MKNKLPDWLKNAPATSLQEKLHGKQYIHHVFCSADRRKPVGTPGSGCCCLRLLREEIQNHE